MSAISLTTCVHRRSPPPPGGGGGGALIGDSCNGRSLAGHRGQRSSGCSIKKRENKE